MAVLQRVRVRGIAHITGGGLLENVPRLLPDGCRAVFDAAAWTPPPLFRFLSENGCVDRSEMYRVFNMGIGMTLIVRPKDVGSTLNILQRQQCEGKVIGRIDHGKTAVCIVHP